MSVSLLLEISFYKQHARAGRVCLRGGLITHNLDQTSHSASAIATKEMLYQSWTSASATHFTLGLFVKGTFNWIIIGVFNCAAHAQLRRSLRSIDGVESSCLPIVEGAFHLWSGPFILEVAQLGVKWFEVDFIDHCWSVVRSNIMVILNMYSVIFDTIIADTISRPWGWGYK